MAESKAFVIQKLLDDYWAGVQTDTRKFLVRIQTDEEAFNSLTDEDRKNLEALADMLAELAGNILDTLATGKHIPVTTNKKSAFYTAYQASYLRKIREILGYNC